MKSKLLLSIFCLCLCFYTCDDSDSDSQSNNSYVEYLGVRYEDNLVTGGCNIQDLESELISCTYLGGFFAGDLNYTISIYHFGLCRSGTFNLLALGDLDLEDEFSGDAAFTMAASEDTVTVELFEGISGTIELVDDDINSSMRFSGEVQSLSTGAITEIEGYLECTIPISGRLQ